MHWAEASSGDPLVLAAVRLLPGVVAYRMTGESREVLQGTGITVFMRSPNSWTPGKGKDELHSSPLFIAKAPTLVNMFELCFSCPLPARMRVPRRTLV
jgi:hypothetical protein